jgi:hypothetical protein
MYNFLQWGAEFTKGFLHSTLCTYAQILPCKETEQKNPVGFLRSLQVMPDTHRIPEKQYIAKKTKFNKLSAQSHCRIRIFSQNFSFGP